MSARDGEAIGTVLVYVRGGKLWYEVYNRDGEICMRGRVAELADFDSYKALCLLQGVMERRWEARKVELCCCGAGELGALMMKDIAYYTEGVYLSRHCLW